jgi:FlaA1/EpsC-like NDP-sugar epimerase
MGDGGEIFILDMGESVRILDLARDIILLSGLKPFEDVEIVFTGLRPGEKLHEELQLSTESVSSTRHPKIRIGKISPYPAELVQSALRRLEQYSFEERGGAIRLLLSEVLPEARLVSPPFDESPVDSLLGRRSLAVGK